MSDDSKTLSDVVRAIEGVRGSVQSMETRLGAQIEVLTEEVGEVKARLDSQQKLTAEVRRLADGQAALVNAVTQLINLEARLARVEAVVFPAKH